LGRVGASNESIVNSEWSIAQFVIPGEVGNLSAILKFWNWEF